MLGADSEAPPAALRHRDRRHRLVQLHCQLEVHLNFPTSCHYLTAEQLLGAVQAVMEGPSGLQG